MNTVYKTQPRRIPKRLFTSTFKVNMLLKQILMFLIEWICNPMSFSNLATDQKFNNFVADHCDSKLNIISQQAIHSYAGCGKDEEWTVSRRSDFFHEPKVFRKEMTSSISSFTKCHPGLLYCGLELYELGYADIISDLRLNSLYKCKNYTHNVELQSCLGHNINKFAKISSYRQLALKRCGSELNHFKGYVPKSYCRNTRSSANFMKNCSNSFGASTAKSSYSFKTYSDAREFKPSHSRVKRVREGNNAKPGQWPWMASLRFRGNHFCGGALIAPEWILTAAHCVKEILNNQIEVVLGNVYPTFPSKGELRMTVHKIYIYPNYNKNSFGNDIALLHLATPVTFNNLIRPLCLSELSVNQTKDCIIAGWGLTKSNVQAPILQQGTVSTLTTEECRIAHLAAFQQEISENPATTICTDARNSHQTGTCRGDSGGPLMCQNHKGDWNGVGIASWTHTHACDKDTTGVSALGGYTRVSAYFSWIEVITGIKTGESTCKDYSSDNFASYTEMYKSEGSLIISSLSTTFISGLIGVFAKLMASR